MRIVIVGYGRVGSWTARVLTEEGHEVVVVDIDETKADRARDRGYEVVEGDGRDEDVLERADLSTADAVGALTGDPNVNFAVCMLAKASGCRTVMRISEDYRTTIYDRYAEDVDEVVYPERMGAVGAKTALLGGDFNAIGDLTERLQLSVVTVPDGSPIVGKHVADVDLVYAHGRGRDSMTIPLPGETVEAGDRLAVIAERDSIDAVRTSLLGA